MKFGTKVREAPKGTGGGKSFIKYPKDGDNRLRIMEEIDEWTEYWEHFDKPAQRSYPCSGDRATCKGCIEKDNDETGNVWGASKKYLVNALDPSTGYVNLWKLPASTKDDFDRYSDRDDGITKRDYTVIKYKGGDGKVKYSVDREERDNLDLAQYADRMQDHQEGLNQAWLEMFGADEQSQEVPETKGEGTPVRGMHAEKKTSWTPEEIDARRREEEKLARVEKDVAKDVPPTEPVQESDAEQETQELSEDELRKMSAPQIKALFQQCGLEAPATDDTAELADKLIEALS